MNDAKTKRNIRYHWSLLEKVFAKIDKLYNFYFSMFLTSTAHHTWEPFPKQMRKWKQSWKPARILINLKQKKTVNVLVIHTLNR